MSARRLFRSCSTLSFALALAALLGAPGTLDAQAAPRPGVLGPGTPPRGPRSPAPRPTAASGTARPATPDSLRPLAVYGTVIDSLSGEVLAGAAVQLVAEQDRTKSFAAISDSSGRWRIPGVLPGRYIAGFFHPSLDALGLEVPLALVEILPDTAARLSLGLPGAERVRATVCPSASPDRGVLLGIVRDPETGEPVPDAKVVLTWKELRINEEGVRNVQRRVPVKVRPDGGYRVCDLPTETDLVANAEAPRRRGGLIELRLGARGTERRDFQLGDSSAVVQVVLPDTTAEKEGRLAQPITVARGRASLAGVVRARDGQVVPGARVQLWGSDATGVTSTNGAFSLSGLPAGTYALEVRAIGYAPTRIPVDLSTRRPANVTVVLGDRVNTLGSVVVQADRTKLQKDFTGFLERSKRGMGRFLNEEQITQRNAIAASDLFRTIPGLNVVPNGTGFGYGLTGRGGNCAPDIFIDGTRVLDGSREIDQLVRPFDVAGIEVYNSAGTVPVQFASAGGGNCGVVVIWTKRGR